MMRRSFVLFMLAVFIATAWAAACAYDAQAAGRFYVFVNKNVGVDSLSSSKIKEIYLGKMTRWADNQKIICVSPARGQCLTGFVERYVGKSIFQFQNYWKKQIFTGKGQPPRSFESQKALEEYIATMPGAIGFSCSAPTSSGVKVISIR